MPSQSADIAEVVFYPEDSASPLTILKPAAFGPGQILLFIIGQDAASALADLTGPAGWTDEGNYDQASNQGRVWSHAYNAADPSTWDFGYNAGADVCGVLLRVINADVTPVITVTSDNTGPNGGTATSPTVTPPAGAGDLYVATMSSACGGVALAQTSPTGLNNLGQGQVVGNYQAIAAAYKQLTDGSATGAQTFTAIAPTPKPGGNFSIAVQSSGLFDPDPPRIPPLPTVSEALLTELLAAKGRAFAGHCGTPWIQERLFGAAVNASVTLVTAAGTQIGDVLYCFHGNDWFTADGLTTPTGTAGTWTLEATGDAGSLAPHLKLWRRVVTVDGPQTVTVDRAVDEEVWQTLIVVGGADPTNPTDIAAGSNGAASTSHVAPAITPTSAYPLLLCGVQGAAAVASYTPPPGMDELTDFSVAGIGAHTAAREVLPATNVSTGTRTFTSTINQAYASISVAVRAAGEAAVADIRAQTGTGPAGVAGQGIAVKAAPVTATLSAGTGGHAIRTIVRPETGVLAAGAGSAATASKNAPGAGVDTGGAASPGTAGKRAPQTGTAATGPEGIATAGKRVAQTGTICAAAAVRATGRKVAAQTGPGVASAVGLATARHVAPRTGTGFAGITSTHSGVPVRAVTGASSAGTVTISTAKHLAPLVAASPAGGQSSAIAVRRSATTGTGVAAAAGRGTAVRITMPVAAVASGMVGSGTGRKRTPLLASVAACFAATAVQGKTAPQVANAFAGLVTRATATTSGSAGAGLPIITVSSGRVSTSRTGGPPLISAGFSGRPTSQTGQDRIESQTTGGRS